MVKGPRARVAAVILAAGRSSRSGAHHKLLATDALGRTMLERSIAQVAASHAATIGVLLPPPVDATGVALHAAASHAVQTLSPDHTPPITLRSIKGAGEGIAASIRAGTAFAQECGAEGLLVCLADMPLVGPKTLDALIAAFTQRGSDVVIPRHDRRGNPVLWADRLYPALMTLRGDCGARTLLSDPSLQIDEVAADHTVLEDFDTPDRLEIFARLT